ncbi:VapE domain-containing protein [Anabaena sp. CCY 9402-a]|uniref:VapE domain-containing protein n=1 Tax=Anabaena sp. CCY 9402-a TaxID=3103867 RepID=UPI0039C5E21C
MRQRNKKGRVGIEVTQQGLLRLRLPRTVADVNARYINTGLDDTPENRCRVQVKAWEIEEDIRHGRLDPTLSRYKPQPTTTTVIVTQQRRRVITDLPSLWDTYCEYRKPLVSTTTYLQKYRRYFANHIQRLPSHNINDAVEIRNYLVTTLPNDAAKRVLEQLNACCNWAVDTGLAVSNPFKGMSNQLKRLWDSDNIDPFSRSERDAILTAYQEHPIYNHYYHFFKFLFTTGCRLGEAVALRWRNIDASSILFCETYNARYKLAGDTKTHKQRRFPCNSAMKELLTSIKNNENNHNPDSLVFLTKYQRKPISSDTIPAICGWRHIVKELVASGEVQRYRPPYNCRHTFITLALEAGLTVPQVAKLVGTTNQENILKDTTGNRRYWVCHITQPIDLTWVAANRDAVWREAVDAFKNGEQWWLKSHEEVVQNEHNEQFTEEDTIESRFLMWLGNFYCADGGEHWQNGWSTKGFQLTAVTTAIYGERVEHERVKDKVSGVLKKHGFYRKRTTAKGVKMTLWYHDSIADVTAQNSEGRHTDNMLY